MDFRNPNYFSELVFAGLAWALYLYS